MARFKAMDYDDILIETLKLFQEGGALLNKIYPRFDHLLIDEFQDVNAVQYGLVKLWARKPKNLFIIGDPDQAIYGFRAADYRYFESIYREFPQAKVFNLSLNYRSTPQILKAASAVINSKDGGLKIGRKDLQAIRQPGPKIRHIQVPTELAQGIAIAHEIKRLVGGMDMTEIYHSKGKPLRSFSDIAILVRTNKEMEQIGECLAKEGIPYRMVGKENVLNEKGVRYTLSFFKSVINHKDDLHHIMALKNPRFCKDDDLIRMVGLYAKENGLTIRSALRKTSQLADYLKTIEDYAEASVKRPKELILRFIEEERDHGFLSKRDIEAIEVLADMAEEFSDMVSFLSSISLSQEADLERAGRIGGEVVTLMTLHSAKGLEWPVVFIAGVEEGLIPLKDDKADYNDSLHEELRLFYVGLTRAEDELILLSSRRRTLFGQIREVEPSSFLKAIPKSCIETKAIKLEGENRKPEQLTLF